MRKMLGITKILAKGTKKLKNKEAWREVLRITREVPGCVVKFISGQVYVFNSLGGIMFSCNWIGEK